MPSPHPPQALTHATSAATGTLLSTLLTYPLDLVTTRLKLQRQLPLDSSSSSTTLLSAFRTISAENNSDPRAFYAGLKADLAKSVADSFLFFLFYTYLTNHTPRPHPLVTGAVAGAAAKLLTTPVANVVTRQQLNTAQAEEPSSPSFWEELEELREEGGLWAGYGASLVLTLNPGVTVWLEGVGRRVFLGDSGRGERGWQTFLLAAGSKVLATAGMYPFVVGRTRVQAGVVEGTGEKGVVKGAVKNAARESIFGTVWRIAREEGVGALYDGIGGEVLKGFFSYGLTMVFKDVVHGLLLKVYVALVVFLRRYPRIRARLVKKMRAARQGVGRMSSVGGQGIKEMREKMGMTSAILGSVISGGEGL